MNRRSHGFPACPPARGLTLTELLVVLAIIALLATIILPVYVNKMQQARIATAKHEVREIAEAEEQCGIVHGFFVPFQILDDLNPTVLRNQSGGTTTGEEPDDLQNSTAGGGFYIIDPNSNLQNQLADANQLRMTSSHPYPNARVETMYQHWQGPFLKFQRYYNKGITNNPTATRNDYPLDPWGQPYRFFSPYGTIGAGARILSGWGDGSFDGNLNNDLPGLYDRFAVVSLGPDGETEGITSGRSTDPRADDIVYVFGALANETSMRFFF